MHKIFLPEEEEYSLFEVVLTHFNNGFRHRPVYLKLPTHYPNGAVSYMQLKVNG